MGADKHLHKLTLPSEAAAWAGLRARPLRSALHVPAHAVVGGAVALAPAGHLLLTASADGSVALRNLSLAPLAPEAGLAGAGLHDVAAGGAATVAFDASGRLFASGGADGAVFVYEALGPHASPAALVALQPAHVPAGAGRGPEGGDVDEPDEATEVEARKAEAARAEAGPDASRARSGLAAAGARATVPGAPADRGAHALPVSRPATPLRPAP
jgi:hypothetical protein